MGSTYINNNKPRRRTKRLTGLIIHYYPRKQTPRMLSEFRGAYKGAYKGIIGTYKGAYKGAYNGALLHEILIGAYKGIMGIIGASTIP